MDGLDLSALKGSKNLLAFSGGVDSSALFFLLIAHGVKFDIALVNYGIREESDHEERHAKQLARHHKLFCHTIKAPKFTRNFEEQARVFRYEFFESLIMVEGYDTLLTAHQLNDQLEWLLMRLCKGAGVSELIGLQPLTQKPTYQLHRPLLSYTKAQLLAYLHQYDYPYCIDRSNEALCYERNRFRATVATPLMEAYGAGIGRSFDYLRADKAVLESGVECCFESAQLSVLWLPRPEAKVRAVDKVLKHAGYLLSAGQREQIAKSSSVVIGGVWVVEQVADRLYIAPYRRDPMPKAFKERCRIAKLPQKIRPYLFVEGIAPEALSVGG